jgi:hypothetical protein
MDCFVASLLAMTATHNFTISRPDTPEFFPQNRLPSEIRGRRECRAQTLRLEEA